MIKDYIVNQTCNAFLIGHVNFVKSPLKVKTINAAYDEYYVSWIDTSYSVVEHECMNRQYCIGSY